LTNTEKIVEIDNKLFGDPDIEDLIDLDGIDLKDEENQSLFFDRLGECADYNKELMKKICDVRISYAKLQPDKVDKWIETVTKDQIKGFFVPVDKLESKPPTWLVQNYIEDQSLAVVFGDPEVGKTFFALDLACSISTGKDFHNLPVKEAPVFYIKGEGHNGFKRRIDAWKKEYNFSQIPLLFTSQSGTALNDPDEVEKISESIKATIEDHSIKQNPGLIVIDTLARNFGDSDENSNKDMSAFVDAIDRLKNEYQCTVLIVHHPGHTNKDRERGAIALRGAVDTSYKLENSGENSTKNLKCMKMKDADRPESLSFGFKSIDLEDTYEGEDNTSLVPKKVDYSPNQEDKKKTGSKLQGKWQKVLLNKLDRLYREKFEKLEKQGADDDLSEVRVSEEELRNACYDAGMGRQTWNNNKTKLMEKGNILLDDKGFYPVM